MKASAAPEAKPRSDTSLPDFEVLIRLLRQRHSCRGFLPERVPKTTIERIIGAAMLSASWCNLQPWQAIVTDLEETDRFRDALYENALACGQPDHRTARNSADFPFPPEFRGVFKARQRECGWGLYESLGIEFGDRTASAAQAMENYRLFGAPHVLILTSERDLEAYGAIDCGGFAGNFLLAAQSLGVATVAQAALASCSSFIRAYFDIPDSRIILFGISFGYPDPAHRANQFRTGRASLAEILDWRGDEKTDR